MVSVRVTVNGQVREAEIEPRLLLVHFLREIVRTTSVHVGCVVGRCGACTVLWKGKPVKSCMVYAVQADGTEVWTVEGLTRTGELAPLQEAFLANDAAECGYCTPGMLISSHALLSRTSRPSDAEIKQAISGNLCRCTGYVNIVRAVRSASAPAEAAVAG